MGEFSIIRRLRLLGGSMPPEIALGPGDDTAVLLTDRMGPRLLLTVDDMVEGVHFIGSTLSPRQMGRRCISVTLSDIAAMGGDPAWALVSCGMDPALWPDDRAMELFGGMKERLDEFKAVMIGGNLTRSETFFVSVTAGGYCSAEPMKRSGARPGDLLVVTGTLGGARLGLDLLLQGRRPGDCTLIDRHVDPPARIEEGRMLRDIAHACIDISDGLLQDLGHMAGESGVGAVVESAALPLPSGEDVSFDEEEGILAALTGGEDYELLAAVPADRRERLDAIRSATSTPLTVIGRVTDAPGRIDVLDRAGASVKVARPPGWDHFTERGGRRGP
jgi:thiamine-monophosphate kinase